MPRTVNSSRQTRLLLSEFSAQPQAWRYGYELAKATGLKSGTLYPTLARLSDQGLLEAEWRAALELGRPARHAYRLTPAGLIFAKEQALRPIRSSRKHGNQEVLA